MSVPRAVGLSEIRRATRYSVPPFGFALATEGARTMEPVIDAPGLSAAGASAALGAGDGGAVAGALGAVAGALGAGAGALGAVPGSSGGTLDGLPASSFLVQAPPLAAARNATKATEVSFSRADIDLRDIRRS
jgi:hypothetical protein